MRIKKGKQVFKKNFPSKVGIYRARLETLRCLALIYIIASIDFPTSPRTYLDPNHTECRLLDLKLLYQLLETKRPTVGDTVF